MVVGNLSGSAMETSGDDTRVLMLSVDVEGTGPADGITCDAFAGDEFFDDDNDDLSFDRDRRILRGLSLLSRDVFLPFWLLGGLFCCVLDIEAFLSATSVVSEYEF